MRSAIENAEGVERSMVTNRVVYRSVGTKREER